jgi:hypothetical protein
MSIDKLLKLFPEAKKILRMVNPQKLSPFMLKPFTPEQLAVIPSEWQVSQPQFVGIAAPKAGTSWWYSLLLEHPQIVNNRLNAKELCYFPHFGYQGINEEQIATYRMAFAAPEGSISGEWSPGYLYYPLCLKYLSIAAPATKILIILRNPIDRMLSHLNQVLTTRIKFLDFKTPEQNYIFSIFSLYPETFFASLYASGLKQALNYFKRSQILVIQYEKCQVNPYDEIARTYRFLGVDADYQPQKIKRIVNKKEYVVSTLKPEERQRLTEYFKEDVRATIQMFTEIDISFWTDFS